ASPADEIRRKFRRRAITAITFLPPCRFYPIMAAILTTVMWRAADARMRGSAFRRATRMLEFPKIHVSRRGGPHAASDDRRRSEALLRGGRLRHPDRVRARVRGRLPLVGAANALLRPILSLHRLQRARLSAVRRAGHRRQVLAGSRARRHPRRDGCAEDRQG